MRDKHIGLGRVTGLSLTYSCAVRGRSLLLGAPYTHWRMDTPEAAMIGSSENMVGQRGGDRDRLRRDQPAAFDDLANVVTKVLARAVANPLKFKE
ncbi:hypothetical protein [Methylocapsa sp. S129]|uniref:hypothetical protein n=1 Tax=Methylocapsa sp. S129 TaxID=1641869 RepID=UPI00131B3147|nr:hypothetical protein [Methylocapsa sp. S129]